MKALLIGGNGFIGSHLIDGLAGKGWSLRVLDQGPERFRTPLPGVEYVLGDYGNPATLSLALEEMDYVFHLVSTTLPKSSNEDPRFDVTSNVIATLHLLEACVQKGIRKVVFLSSGGTVYGTPCASPIPEDHPTNPTCSYGITKLTIEKYLALFKELHGLDYVVLRPSNPYGTRQNPFGTQGAIAVFLGKARLNHPIEIWGDGQVVRDYLHIHDLVDGIIRAATTSGASPIFNLGSGRGHSLIGILDVIEKAIGRSLVVNFSPGRIFDLPTTVLDITRAERELQWRPSTSLEDGIRTTWEFVQRLP